MVPLCGCRRVTLQTLHTGERRQTGAQGDGLLWVKNLLLGSDLLGFPRAPLQKHAWKRVRGNLGEDP